MVDTNELENFLNNKVAKGGDIVEIIGEGEIMKDVQTQFGVKDLLNIPVRLNGREITWSPNKKARDQMNKLCKTTNTKDWVGKKFQVVILEDKGKETLMPGNLVN